ncbi:hypothetical protein TNCV_4941581 [Trichonephila clavipes]|nr:hypothetical protein TNCV_4941581 [Trichonephila clavipes]
MVSCGISCQKFAPIMGQCHHHSPLVDAVAFPSYPRLALLKRHLAIWLAKEVLTTVRQFIATRAACGMALSFEKQG